jgi:biotin transport system ATP-binding protein
MVFQEPDCQIVGESVAADVAFGPENLRLPRPEIERRVNLALADVGLQGYETRHPHELSGGEKRRLAIAGVLVLQPSVVALDEPLANLDYPGMLQLLEQIRRLHTTGHTQLVATHELDPLIDTADRLVMLHRGRVVWDGPPREGAALAERFGVRPLCGCRRLWPAGGAR